MNVQEQNQETIQIGKNGMKTETIDKIKKSLSKNKLVKIKFLKNTLEKNNKEDLVKNIIEQVNINTETKIVGNTLFLKRIKN